jgi:hypothetical protein
MDGQTGICTELGGFWAVFFLLFVFGLGFNWLVTWMHRHGHSDGYTWLLVVIGVGVTLLAAGPVVGWEPVLMMFALFAASGLPMAAGDAWRRRQALADFMRYRSGDAEKTEGMGQ